MKQQPVQLHHVRDEGTDNPIVNRMFLQFSQIIKSGLLRLPQDEEERFKEILYGCMEDLLKLEEICESFLEKENKALKAIDQRLEEYESGDVFQFHNPSAKLKKHFEDFLIRGVIAIRKTVQMAKILVGDKIKGPRDFLPFAQEELPERRDYHDFLQKDKKWVKELYDYRAEVEHSGFECKQMEIDFSKDTKPLISFIGFSDQDISFRNYMTTTLENVFTFCEDITAMLINYTLQDTPVVLVLVPKEQRTKHRNFKYVLDLRKKHPELDHQ